MGLVDDSAFINWLSKRWLVLFAPVREDNWKVVYTFNSASLSCWKSF